MTHLTSLVLVNNSLSGEVPDLNIPTLQELNLASNNLSGVVPKSLERFPSGAFSGNNLVSSHALPPSFAVQTPNPHPTRKKSKGLREPALLGIIIGGCVLGVAVIATFAIVCCILMFSFALWISLLALCVGPLKCGFHVVLWILTVSV